MPTISFRPLTEDDFPVLVEWFNEPAIGRWWNQTGDLASVRNKYRPRISGREAISMWIATVDHEPAGLFQFYRHQDHPDQDELVGIPDAVGIDYLLGSRHRGRGLSGDVLREFAALALANHPTLAVCIATPAQANEPSCRALERAGFTRRGVCQPLDEPPQFIYALDRSGSQQPTGAATT